MKRFPHTIFFLLALLVILTPAVMAAPPELASRVVVLHDDVESPGAIGLEIARQVGGQVGFIYEHALKGFSILVPPQALGALEKNPNVKYVATDDIRYAVAQVLPTGIKRIFADTNASIGIDGIDDFRVDVDVAVIDTGIDFNHPDLNVVGGINCAAGNILRAKCIEGGDDDHSHGTHVAGTIGALDNDIGVVGVAPGARLWAVKVLNSRGSGYTSWIIAGIDWVAANAGTIKVANMSLSGSGYNQAEYDAINGAVNKGVAFAVAAVKPSKATYKPSLSEKTIKGTKKGQGLSDIQTEAVTCAGRTDERAMPNGQRMGYFIGDGTGVVLGSEIAANPLDDLIAVFGVENVVEATGFKRRVIDANETDKKVIDKRGKTKVKAEADANAFRGWQKVNWLTFTQRNAYWFLCFPAKHFVLFICNIF